MSARPASGGVVHRVVGRKADQRILGWIKDRVRGTSTLAIAARDGVPSSQVLASTNAVKRADRLESGEDVGGAYW